MTNGASKSSFEQFYLEHHVRAVGWAVALVGRPAVAEDLAHDALIRVGSRLDGLDDPSAYLRRSVVNACRSWHRSSTREARRFELEASSRDLAVYDPATAEVLELLANLPYRQRAALVLRYWADWSTSQIAEALGCQEVTVRVLAHRALRTLRHELTAMEET